MYYNSIINIVKNNCFNEIINLLKRTINTDEYISIVAEEELYNSCK